MQVQRAAGDGVWGWGRLDDSNKRRNFARQRLLRNVYGAERFHALLSFLLLLKKFAFARNVAAIALGGDVFAEGSHRFARDNLPANRGLDRDLILLVRDHFLEFRGQRASPALCLVAMDDA